MIVHTAAKCILTSLYLHLPLHTYPDIYARSGRTANTYAANLLILYTMSTNSRVFAWFGHYIDHRVNESVFSLNTNWIYVSPSVYMLTAVTSDLELNYKYIHRWSVSQYLFISKFIPFIIYEFYPTGTRSWTWVNYKCLWMYGYGRAAMYGILNDLHFRDDCSVNLPIS